MCSYTSSEIQKHVVFVRDAGELAHVFLAGHRTGRVAGAVDDECSGVVRDVLLDCCRVERQILAHGNGFRRPTREMGQGVVRDEAGVGEDDFLACADVGFEGDVKRLAPARRGDDVPWGHLDFVVAFVFCTDSLTKFENSLVRRVGVRRARFDGVQRGLSRVVRCREVRLSESEIDRVLTCGFEHFPNAAYRYVFDPVRKAGHTPEPTKPTPIILRLDYSGCARSASRWSPMTDRAASASM